MDLWIYEEYFDWFLFNYLKFSLCKIAVLKIIYIHIHACVYINAFGMKKFLNPCKLC